MLNSSSFKRHVRSRTGLLMHRLTDSTERAVRWAALLLLVMPTLGAATAPPQVVWSTRVVESGWKLQMALQDSVIRCAGFNPVDGCVYYHSESAERIRRFDPYRGGEVEDVGYADRARDMLVDPKTGNVYFSEVYDGGVFRIAYANNTECLGRSVSDPECAGSPAYDLNGDGFFDLAYRDVWLSGFVSGDDDPLGLDVAPGDFSGPILLPRQGLLVDGGYGSSSDAVWTWSLDQAQGEVRISTAPPAPRDLVVTKSGIYMTDDAYLAIIELFPDGTVEPLALSEDLAWPMSMTLDPITDELLVYDYGTSRVLRVDPKTGSAKEVLTGVFSYSTGALDFSPDGRFLAVCTREGTEDVLLIFERRLLTSNDPCRAQAVSGSLQEQLSVLNGIPPVFDASSWEDVHRHADLGGTSGFSCPAPLDATGSTGAVQPVPLPSGLAHNQYESNDSIRVMSELHDVQLAAPLPVDVLHPQGAYDDPSDIEPAVIVAGTRVASHLLHFDSVGNDDVVLSGSVTFPTEILAVQVLEATLSAVENSQVQAGIPYPDGLQGRGLEIQEVTDGFSVSPDRRTLTVDTRVTNWMDQVRVITVVPDRLLEPYVLAPEGLPACDEVTLDNCSSAFYRFTFELPDEFFEPSLRGVANVDDQGVLYLNGTAVTAQMLTPACDPATPDDPCYGLMDAGSDRTDISGRPVLSSGSRDFFSVEGRRWFRPGINELVFAVCGDASPLDPTGLEFSATLKFATQPIWRVVEETRMPTPAGTPTAGTW